MYNSRFRSRRTKARVVLLQKINKKSNWLLALLITFILVTAGVTFVDKGLHVLAAEKTEEFYEMAVEATIELIEFTRDKIDEIKN